MVRETRWSAAWEQRTFEVCFPMCTACVPGEQEKARTTDKWVGAGLKVGLAAGAVYLVADFVLNFTGWQRSGFFAPVLCVIVPAIVIAAIVALAITMIGFKRAPDGGVASVEVSFEAPERSFSVNGEDLVADCIVYRLVNDRFAGDFMQQNTGIFAR